MPPTYLYAWFLWVPPKEPGGSAIARYSETVVPQHVLKYFNELKEKKTFICVLEELGLAAPYFSPE